MRFLVVICFCFASALAQGSVGPVECAKAADRLLRPNLITEEIIQLCQGATSDEPVKCVEQAFRLISPAFSKAQSIAICRGATALNKENFTSTESAGE